jgi:hypothetical protein
VFTFSLLLFCMYCAVGLARPMCDIGAQRACLDSPCEHAPKCRKALFMRELLATNL